MIQVVIEMDPQTSALNIKSAAPPLLVFGVIVAAYHEMLSLKIQSDAKTSERRILLAGPDGLS